MDKKHDALQSTQSPQQPRVMGLLTLSEALAFEKDFALFGTACLLAGLGIFVAGVRELGALLVFPGLVGIVLSLVILPFILLSLRMSR